MALVSRLSVLWALDNLKQQASSVEMLDSTHWENTHFPPSNPFRRSEISYENRSPLEAYLIKQSFSSFDGILELNYFFVF